MIYLKSSKIILVLTILFLVFLSTFAFLFLVPSKPTFADDCQVETNATVKKDQELKVEVKHTAPVDYTLTIYFVDPSGVQPIHAPIYTDRKQGVTPGASLVFTVPGSVFQNEGKYIIHVRNEAGGFNCVPAAGTAVELIPSGKNPCTEVGCETALGNIPTSVGGFAQRVLNIAIGLAGGIALILMVIGSIRVLTSSGDQQKLAGGRDMIVAAIAGLLFLI